MLTKCLASNGSDAPIPEEHLLTAIRRALLRLPMLDRQLIALHFGGGLSHSQIAQALALPHPLIGHRLRAALSGMNSHLEREGVTEPVSCNSVGHAVTSGMPAPVGLHEKIQQRISIAIRNAGGLRREIGISSRFVIVLAVYISACAHPEEPQPCTPPVLTTSSPSPATSALSASTSRTD